MVNERLPFTLLTPASHTCYIEIDLCAVHLQIQVASPAKTKAGK